MRSIVYYYTHIPQPFAEVAELLTSDPEAWLPEPVEADGADWLVRLHADGALPAPVALHQARLTLAPATLTYDTLRRAVTWRSAVSDQLVPVLEGDLEVACLTGYGCQLSLMGSYRPPLSVVGEAGDRLLGRRVAEACVRRFVLDIAGRMEGATLHA